MPLHDIALNDIRKAFETKATVQGYYTENILQTRTDFKNDEWFKPFVELNSDAMVAIDSKVGTLHLAIEFDLTHKSHRRYQRKLNAYYGQDKIDGVLYVCADEYICRPCSSSTTKPPNAMRANLNCIWRCSLMSLKQRTK